VLVSTVADLREFLMLHLPEPLSPLVGMGMTSMVLGVIALLLFFMPILGIPISVIGLVFGLIGLIVFFTGGGPSVRWSLGGIFLCGLALLVNFALNYAPPGYVPGRETLPPWQPVYDRPYVPPPADGFGGP
jgi:hypothetical protein